VHVVRPEQRELLRVLQQTHPWIMPISDFVHDIRHLEFMALFTVVDSVDWKQWSHPRQAALE
jgi:hypothetical protein